jgi:hypothetical protein
MSDNQITVITEVSQAQVTVNAQPVTISETVHSVTVVESSNEISIAYGSPGAQGPQGAPGSGATNSITAGENLSGHRIIAILNNLAYLADPTNLSHGLVTIGVVRDAVSVGNTAIYYLTGEVSGGAFTANTDYFVGLNGTLSTTPRAPGATWMKRIGTAISSSILVIDPDPVILL